MADIEKSLGQIEGLLQNMGGKGSMDPMALLALMKDNGLGGDNLIVFLLFFMLLRNGGLEGNSEADVQNAVKAAINEASANQANFAAIKDAVTSNGADIRQLAQTLNCDFNALQKAICDLQYAIGSVSAEVKCGTDKVLGAIASNGERIINSIIQGNCDIKSAISNCCCDVLRAIDNKFSDLALRDQANNSALQLAISNLNSTVIEQGNLTRQTVKDTAKDQEIERLTRELDDAKEATQTAKIIAAVKAATAD